MKIDKIIAAVALTTLFFGCSMTEKEKDQYVYQKYTEQQKADLEKLEEEIKDAKTKRDEIVEIARDFALDNTKNLKEDKRSYIRFTEPIIYRSEILESEVKYNKISYLAFDFNEREKKYTGFETTMINVVWYLPNEELPLIITGTGKNDLTFFDPTKILREKLFKGEVAAEVAETKAREYAMEYVLYLQDRHKIHNYVRIQKPDVRETNFDLDIKTTYFYEDLGRKDKKELMKQDFKQISFIWPIGNNENVVVSGLWYENKGTKEFLTNWEPIKADIYLNREIK
jgi:hypothetical protein